jgi:hypothetical protein
MDRKSGRPDFEAAREHGITLGRETVRLWMVDARLWLDCKQRQKRVHQPRYRRDCIGELVQADGCENWWFEDRGRNGYCSFSSMTRPAG